MPIIKPPGEPARIEGTAVPVWALEYHMRQGWSSVEIRSAFPQLSAEQVQEALEYADSHKAEIDHDIVEYRRPLG
jgi:uncharacterized protein (DUF433 family)